MSKTFVTQTELAAELGVDRRQVYQWHARRARNGFPEHAREERRRGKTPTKMWDLDEVLRWRQQYVPSLGGRKPRNPS